MRATLLAAAVLSAVPALARAQLANRAISLESGLSTPFGRAGSASAAVAVSASRWLDGFDRGDLEGVLRVGLGSAAGTGGRAANAVLATAGLRLSLGRAPLRPQVFADLGWARVRGEARAERFAFGVGAALEAFPAPALSVSARAAVRGVGGALAGETVVAVATYF